MMNSDWAMDETLEMLRDQVRRFCDEEIAPRAAAIDADNQFPGDLWTKFGALGLLGMTVPEQYGGSGMGFLAHLLALEEISRASGSVGLSYGAASNLCIDNLYRSGSESQRERYLPKLCTGEWVGALAMSESGAGSDVIGSMNCRAQWNGTHWVANGSKMWITNGPDADILIVYMRTSNNGARDQSVTAFIVEKELTGVTTSPKLDKLGMRGSNGCELVFQDCLIPAENVLGLPHEGTGILMGGLNTERLVLSGGPLGIMQAALDLALPYVRERKQFGRAIGELGVIQAKIADMYVALQSSRAYAYRIAEAYDAGQASRLDPAGCLLHASRQAVLVALETIQVLGGNGYINDYPAGRLLRDAKLYEIGAGTNEIRKMLIGRELVRGNA